MKNYWVLNKPTLKASIDINGKEVVLENSLIKRVVSFSKGNGSLYNKETKEEMLCKFGGGAVVSIDGKETNIFSDAVYSGCKITDIEKQVEYSEKPFATEIRDYPPSGKAVKLLFKNEVAELSVHYEIYDDLPVIAVNVKVKNISNRKITLSGYCIDKMFVSKDTISEMYAETNYNGGCDRNSNRILSVVYDEPVLSLRIDVGPDCVLEPGDMFNGIWGYELLHTAKYYENKLIEIKEMYRVLTPWVLESPLIFHVLSNDFNYNKKIIDDIKEVGFQMLIQSFGSDVDIESTDNEYIDRHRELYEYAHSKGIAIGGYTLAIVKDYKEIHGDECNVYADPKTKIMRCLACDWSDKYWKNIFNFYDATGADAIEIDGPYHFPLCSGGKTHHHCGLSDSRYAQWNASTNAVMGGLKKMGVYINAPDWMFFNGANKAGIGYEEIAFSQPRQEQLIVSRIYNYKGTFNKIPSMGWGFVPIDEYQGGGSSATFSPLSENIKDYDWVLFQNLVAGILPCFRGKSLFDSNETKALVKKWAGFYNKYKEVINGNTVHFLPPKQSKTNPLRGEGLDAILNEIPRGAIRGMLAVFNQTDSEITQKLQVPLFYTGLCDYSSMPIPKANSGLCEVENPVYGEYPPGYPKSYEKNPYTCFNPTGYGEKITYEMQRTAEQSAPTNRKVIFSERDEINTLATINTNCDAELEVTLKPMSYTWFVIKPSL